VTTSSPRSIPLVHAIGLVVANMIGTGIFTTTGLLVEQLGSPLWILGVWLLGGVVAMCGADVYAELGAMMPRAGGEYVYLSRAIHPAAGFLSGWVSLIVGFSAPIAASAIGFGSYLAAVVPGVPRIVAAVTLIATVTVLHMTSIRWGARLQTTFTAMKVGLLLVLICAGFAIGNGSWDHLRAEASGAPRPARLAVALLLVSFAYSGWNGAAYVAGELRNPARTLPRALVGGTALVLTLYVALNLVFFYAAPPSVLAGQVEVAEVAATALFGQRAGLVLSLLVALALVSSVSAMMMTGPRVYVAMAEDGLFFRTFARRSGTGAPWASVALQGVIGVVLALSATFEQLLVYIGFVVSLSSTFAVLAAFVLRHREPLAARPYRARAWPLSPLLFLALSLWAVTYAVATRPVESLAGVATLALGLALYAARRAVSREGRRPPHD
jgi:basic amino acid/polyamine antiporter, APA family